MWVGPLVMPLGCPGEAQQLPPVGRDIDQPDSLVRVAGVGNDSFTVERCTGMPEVGAFCDLYRFPVSGRIGILLGQPGYLEYLKFND